MTSHRVNRGRNRFWWCHELNEYDNNCDTHTFETYICKGLVISSGDQGATSLYNILVKYHWLLSCNNHFVHRNEIEKITKSIIEDKLYASCNVLGLDEDQSYQLKFLLHNDIHLVNCVSDSTSFEWCNMKTKTELSTVLFYNSSWQNG